MHTNKLIHSFMCKLDILLSHMYEENRMRITLIQQLNLIWVKK